MNVPRRPVDKTVDQKVSSRDRREKVGGHYSNHFPPSSSFKIPLVSLLHGFVLIMSQTMRCFNMPKMSAKSLSSSQIFLLSISPSSERISIYSIQSMTILHDGFHNKQFSAYGCMTVTMLNNGSSVFAIPSSMLSTLALLMKCSSRPN